MLLLYFVMTSEGTPRSVKLLIGSALAASAQSIDTINVQPTPDYLDFNRLKIEVALQQYDSIMCGNLSEYPFGVVFQDGKGGVYDFRNLKLLTEIIYGNMTCAGKKNDDDEVYHLFRWEVLPVPPCVWRLFSDFDYKSILIAHLFDGFQIFLGIRLFREFAGSVFVFVVNFRV